MPPSPVTMNAFARQWRDTEDEVLAAVREVGQSGWYILGEEVAAFETSLAAYLGRRHAVGCANGMDAIEMGLRALKLQPNQRVLTTPLSAFATSLAILRAGGVPVFVDVDATGLLDLDLVERELERDAGLRFVVPVHLYGQALDLDHLEALKRRHDLRIVEDLAQAVGARSGARVAGGVGQVSAISFYPTKNLGALGDGGALVTDDRELDRACRMLRDYGQSSKYVHEVPGLNSRLDELHAAVLRRAFLPRVTGWTERRAAIAASYDAGLRHPDLKPLPRPARSRAVWHLYPTFVAAGKRDALVSHLEAQGVRSAVHYPTLICDQPALAAARAEVRGGLEHARRLAVGELSLPLHPYLTDAEVTRVIDAVNSWSAPS